ncbi:hypothetical protein AAHH79_41645, partial [Burkholderia pseudomallei]
MSPFHTPPHTPNLTRKRRAPPKSIHHDVPCDTPPERAYVESLEQDDALRQNAKMPGSFKIQTPLGSYIPYSAVL